MSDNDLELKPPPELYYTRVWQLGKHAITERVPEGWEPKATWPRYIVTITTGMQTPLGPRKAQKTVPILAESIEQAFEYLPSVLTRTEAELQGEIRKSLIAQGQAMPLRG